MVLAYHVIFGTYGFWLPNDPRGSWSEFVGSYELLRYGRATRTDERCSLAHRPHDQEVRLAAKAALKRPAVCLDGCQAQAVGRAFGEYAARAGVAVLACSIVPDHVHLVLGRSELSVEAVVVQLKAAASRRLLQEGLHPLAGPEAEAGHAPKMWQRGLWKVFLDCGGGVRRAIRYVEDNPLKEGKRRQRWSFVEAYEVDD